MRFPSSNIPYAQARSPPYTGSNNAYYQEEINVAAEDHSRVPGSALGGCGAYGDRELAAEEQEEIRCIKQQDVSSARNALRLAQQAEETERDTLARLGARASASRGMSVRRSLDKPSAYNNRTERSLNHASTQNRIAEEKARELKSMADHPRESVIYSNKRPALNRSIIAVHVSNPFTANKMLVLTRISTVSNEPRLTSRSITTHQQEREDRDATRKAAWHSAARNAGVRRNLADTNEPRTTDSEDDGMDNYIDSSFSAHSHAIL